MMDYLVDEVLAREPAEVRDFLLRTAVLDRLTGPLCDAVTGRSDGTATLEDLERRGLFLVPLDTERSWYRYHHLFADVLRARLLAEHPEQVSDLHQRAGEWFGSPRPGRGRRAARARRRATSPVRRTSSRRRSRSCAAAAGRPAAGWVRSLPDSVVRPSPVLSILSGWSLMMSGDLDAVGVPARRRRDARSPPVPRTRTSPRRGRTPTTCAPPPRRSRSTARRWLRPAATWPARCGTPGAPWTSRDPTTTWCAGPGEGSSDWPPGRRGTCRRRCPRSAGRSEPARRRQLRRRAGRHRGARRPAVARAARPAPAGCTSGRRSVGRAPVSPTRGPSPTCTSGWPSSTASSTTWRAPGRTWRPRGCSVSAPRSPRTGTGGPWPWRSSAPRRGDDTRRSCSTGRGDYRHGFYPDVRPIAAMRARVQIVAGRPVVGRPAGPTTVVSGSTTTRTTCTSTST